MQWIPLHPPRPQDGKRYDIRLKNGDIVTNVTYWDFGAGFEPLELDEPAPPSGHSVKYPLSLVIEFRPTAVDG